MILVLNEVIRLSKTLYRPGHAKTCPMSYANNKGADQRAHPQSDQHLCCSLPRQYMYTCYIQSFKILASSEAEQAGLNLTWSKIPEDTFLHDVAHISLYKLTHWCLESHK